MQRTHPIGYPKKTVLTDNDVDSSSVTGPAVDCVITSIRISNTTGSAITFDLVDKASTPNQWFEAVSIAANSVANELLSLVNDAGLFCEGGFNYNASAATGLDIQITYWTNPGA